MAEANVPEPVRAGVSEGGTRRRLIDLVFGGDESRYLTGRTIRWRTIQVMLDAGYVDGYRRLHRSEPGYTFPTWKPHVRLDYVFVPGSFADRLRASRVVTEPVPVVASASDHHPLLAELAV